MAISKPKKKKLIRIIIIILSRIEAELDNDKFDTLGETVWTQLCQVRPQTDEDEEGWSDEQGAVWDATEAMLNAMEGQGEPDLESLSGNLQIALDEL